MLSLEPLLFSLLSTPPPPPPPFTSSCRNAYPPESPTHDKSQDGSTFPPRHPRLRQGNFRAFHPNCCGYAHRVGLSCRRTKSPLMLSNVERLMSCSISSSSSDRPTPRNTQSTHPISSPARLCVRGGTATRNPLLTNLTLDSPTGETWLAFAGEKAGPAVHPHLSRVAKWGKLLTNSTRYAELKMRAMGTPTKVSGRRRPVKPI